MRRWIIGGICAGLLSFGSVVYASDTIQALLFPVKIFIHGSKEGAQGLTALNYNGSTYVPLRYLAEKFGAEVTYYEDTKLIDINAKAFTFMKSDIGDGMPDHIGGSTADTYDRFLYNRDSEAGVELAAKTGYGPFTGAFFSRSPQEVGYSLSSGTMKSGSEVQMSVYDAPDGANIRVRLSKLDPDLKPIAIIKEHTAKTYKSSNLQTLFSTFLPSAPNSLYLLSAEVLGPDNKPEDTVLSTIYVPAQEMIASIRTDKKVYGSGEPIILSIANNGPSEVTYGLPYQLEKRIDGDWYIQPLNQAWFDIGYSLRTGETGDQILSIPVLEPGQYRIIKNLQAQAAGWSATLATEFTVEE